MFSVNQLDMTLFVRISQVYVQIWLFSSSESQEVKSWSHEVRVLRSVSVYLIDQEREGATQSGHSIDDVVFRGFRNLEEARVVPIPVFLEVVAVISLHLLEACLVLQQVPKSIKIIAQVAVLEVEVLVAPQTWSEEGGCLNFSKFEPFCFLVSCFDIICGPDFVENGARINLSAASFHKRCEESLGTISVLDGRAILIFEFPREVRLFNRVSFLVILGKF